MVSRSPSIAARREQIKQRINRVVHAKREYNSAQAKATAAKRRYVRAALLLLYDRNNGARNNLLRLETNQIRNMINNSKRVLMAERVLSRHLPQSLIGEVIQKI